MSEEMSETIIHSAAFIAMNDYRKVIFITTMGRLNKNGGRLMKSRRLWSPKDAFGNSMVPFTRRHAVRAETLEFGGPFSFDTPHRAETRRLRWQRPGLAPRWSAIARSPQRFRSRFQP